VKARLRTCTCASVYKSTRIFVPASQHWCIYMHMLTYACLRTSMYGCTCLFMLASKYLPMCMYAHTHACMCVYHSCSFHSRSLKPRLRLKKCFCAMVNNPQGMRNKKLGCCGSVATVLPQPNTSSSLAAFLTIELPRLLQA
jgi:hypothetical protein